MPPDRIGASAAATSHVARAHSAPRVALVASGMILMLVGGWAGLVRMGWPLSAAPHLIGHHGTIMIMGFLGTVIGVERAVGARRPWTFTAPVLTAAGGIAFVLGAPLSVASGLMLAGAVVLALTLALVARMVRGLAGATLAISGIALVAGAGAVALDSPPSFVVGWWVAFVTLIIAAERLELSRLLRAPRWAILMFGSLCAILVTGVAMSAFAPAPGVAIAGASLAGISAWLFRYDISARVLRAGGRYAFSAVALLAGYAWLLVAGTLFLWQAARGDGWLDDAALHAVFVGFAVSMVFGHAPIVVGAVVGRNLAFHRVSYLPLALLHVSVLMRVGGWIEGSWTTWRASGMLNGVAILMFFAITLVALRTTPGSDDVKRRPAGER